MTDFIDLALGVLGGKSPEELGCRKIAQLDARDNAGIGVSTMWMPDVERYETAVYDGFEPGATYPVERYMTEEAALEGHAKWVSQAKPGVEIKPLGVGDSEFLAGAPHVLAPANDSSADMPKKG